MRATTFLITLFAAFACGEAFVAPSRSATCVGRSVAGGLPKSSSLREYKIVDRSMNVFHFHHRNLMPPFAHAYARVSLSLLSILSAEMSAFDGIKEPVQSYVDIWTPMFKQASESGLVPDFLLHWGHGAAMASVLLSMGVIGAYSEWISFLHLNFVC